MPSTAAIRLQIETTLAERVPAALSLKIKQAPELTILAKAGAFNWTGEKHDRRTAHWGAQRAGQSVGQLFENIPNEHEIDAFSPLLSMMIDERLVADFFITGFTIGPHPMAYRRAEMNKSGVLCVADLKGNPRRNICPDCRSHDCPAAPWHCERFHLSQ
jgi:hypothetical protein